MKKPTIQIFTGFLFALLAMSCSDAPKYDLSNIPSERPGDILFMQRAFPYGEIETQAYPEAIAWKQSQNIAKSGGGTVWEFTGPLNIGGRISDIAIDPVASDTYYVGAASGGIFKTTDGGASWLPIFDGQQYLSIGDIEISTTDSNKIYVGTGEPNAGGGSLAYDGNGIFKSTDGGLTWESKGLPDIGSVGKIVVDPTDDETLYVGAMGPLFRDDPNKGVYKSTDGGDTWSQVLFVSEITGVIDMVIHPTNPNIVYAATWERIRRPDFRIYGGETSRIYRSTDAGATWTELTAGLPSLPEQKGRISIDIAQSNPDVLYALYADRNGSIFDVFKTTNGGNSWSSLGGGGLTNVGFHWWFGGITVDPNDENTLYNIGFVMEKSTDGGASWGPSFSGVHVDQHALAFHPSIADLILLGNDGGLYTSTDAGNSWTFDDTLPITQFYRIKADPQNSDRLYGGSQDNSTFRTTTGGLSDFTIITGGDGFQPLIDPTDSGTIYTLAQRGFLQKSIDDAASFNVVLSGVDGSERKNWDTPIVFDPANSNIVYYGAERLYKSVDGAINWNAISPILHDGPYPGNNGFGTLTSIDVSAFDSDKIVIGYDDGNIWTTTDGGSNWTQVSSTLPDRWVTKVLTSRFDTNTLYVTLSGYRFGEDNGHVYKSTDFGASWTNIGASLPDIPVNDIVQDAFGNLFLGTDIGVLGSEDEGATWVPIGANMPAVVVTDLDIHEADELLFAATYGRSSYKLDISVNVLSTDEFTADAELILAPNPANELLNITSSLPLQDASLSIYNALGQVVLELPFSQSIDVSELQAGVYFLQLSSAEGTQTKRFIKR
ncbi:VPS10 domain-containing protein [Gilvibacter sp.]|uniref:T9SS type A sorting domain-containing protein n=1 Tax=Gilvibacter sp. TaxID=2729997 RepID=UPI003F4A0FEC